MPNNTSANYFTMKLLSTPGRKEILGTGNDETFLNMCKCLTLSIAYAANCGGIGSLTGTGPNLIMKGQLDQ